VRVRFVDPDLIDGYAALHRLTAAGRDLGIPWNEIWIAEDLEEIAEVLVFHETVEYQMRKRGMQHAASHNRAMGLERERFEGTPIYRRAKQLLKNR
jgi:hypothetical protein